jgi:hypothetical protein
MRITILGRIINKGAMMNSTQNTDNCLIRISKQTRDLLKAKCKQEQRLMGGYADMLINEALADRTTSDNRKKGLEPTADHETE